MRGKFKNDALGRANNIVDGCPKVCPMFSADNPEGSIEGMYQGVPWLTLM
jgi:hypothetical protein